MKKKIMGVGFAGLVTLISLYYQTTKENQLFLKEKLLESDHRFIAFVAKYGKSYGTKTEFEFRATLFSKTLAKILSHPKNSTS
jgi:hypothetical protein